MMPELEAGLTGIATLTALLSAYALAGHPLLMRLAATRFVAPEPPPEDGSHPLVALVVPAHGEAAAIAGKITDLAEVLPTDPAIGPAVRVALHIDGCPATATAAWRALETLPPARRDAFTVHVHSRQRGKLATLVAAIQALPEDTAIVAFSDVSARFDAVAFARAVAHFRDPTVGAVCGEYAPSAEANGHAGERRYWRMQTALRRGEAALGAPMGMPGAFYAIRRAALVLPPSDTINDDFVIPMQAVAAGWRALLDPAILVRESEADDTRTERRRRRRIGAGNLQQAWRLCRLANPRRPGIALAFLSGKALRALLPFLVVAHLAAANLLALSAPAEDGGVLTPSVLVGAWGLFASLALASLLGLAGLGRNKLRHLPGSLVAAAYAADGLVATGVGALDLLRGRYRRGWRRVGNPQGNRAAAKPEAAIVPEGPAAPLWPVPVSFVSREVAAAKRLLDITGASVGLILLAPVMAAVALAVRLDSPGPVLYRQLRVGRIGPEGAQLFELIKFRSMRQDAEAKTGPVWAGQADPRVTRIGRFLRKTRLDELPQLINVLKGDMALIGPRPERPVFCGKLEKVIPGYIERTAGVKPGLSGLAQVEGDYDSTLEDVRRKIVRDVRYALALGDLASWFTMDMRIILRTIGVVLAARGR